MTVEEIEIIVTAKTEEAIKEFKKIAPTVAKVIQQVQESLQKVDTKSVTNKINQAVQFVKKKIENLKKSNQNNEVKIDINNKEALKQISQLEKEIDSLQKKISGRQMKLNITNDTLDKMRAEKNQEVISEMPEAGTRRINKETYSRLENDTSYNSLVKESDKLNSEVEKYNLLLDIAKTKLEEEKQKVSEIQKETSKTGTSQNRLTSFFDTFKGKMQQVNSIAQSVRNIFSKMPNVTKIVTNNIKKIGSGLKSGLGHVLKYARYIVIVKGNIWNIK